MEYVVIHWVINARMDDMVGGLGLSVTVRQICCSMCGCTPHLAANRLAAGWEWARSQIRFCCVVCAQSAVSGVLVSMSWLVSSMSVLTAVAVWSELLLRSRFVSRKSAIGGCWRRCLVRVWRWFGPSSCMYWLGVWADW